MASNKIGKYANADAVVDSTLTQPKRRTDTSYVSVEEQLNAAVAAKKLRLLITNSAGALFLVLIAIYSVIAGTMGFMSYNSGSLAYVTRPAFASAEIEGGYVKEVGVKVYGSTSNKPNTDFFSQVQAGFLGAPKPVIGEILNLDSYAKVFTKEGALYISKDGTETKIDGKYVGNIDGEYSLEDQYIVKCISGSCVPDTIFFLPRVNIYGVV